MNQHLLENRFAEVPSDFEVPLSQAEFEQLRDLIHHETGIFLANTKQTLLKSRLNRRLRALGIDSYAEYTDYLKRHDPRRVEREQMINCITTNKTDFFREGHHFEFLKNTLFRKLEQQAAAGREKKLRIWSAACSTGEEPYSIAMTVRDHFGTHSGWDIRILATDIDTRVLEQAEAGCYDSDRLEGTTPAQRKKFFWKRKEAGKIRYQANEELRSLIAFRQLNFMEPNWPINVRFDAIFCRNVIIYFNSDTQDQLMRRMHDYLHPHGHLFLGHSESLLRLNDLYDPLGQTIYAVHPGSSRPVQRQATRATATRTIPSTSIIVGEVHASSRPSVVRTVLGSCIALCLYDPEAKVGGMNHFMLPQRAGHERDSASYGVYAVDLLINQMMAKGADRRRIVAKVFGGAAVLANMQCHDVGTQNIEFTLNCLATEKIPVVAKYVGGTRGMQVLFETHTGKAKVRLLDSQQTLRVEEEEEAQFAAWERKVERSADVTLF